MYICNIYTYIVTETLHTLLVNTVLYFYAYFENKLKIKLLKFKSINLYAVYKNEYSRQPE